MYCNTSSFTHNWKVSLSRPEIEVPHHNFKMKDDKSLHGVGLDRLCSKLCLFFFSLLLKEWPYYTGMLSNLLISYML